MNFDAIKQQDTSYIEPVFNRFPVALESGKNATMKDFDGKEYVDFTSGIGVNALGINDEDWKQAVIEQLNKIQHACNLYYTLPQTELAELICQKSGAKKVCYANSGAEANECAIKAIRKYNSDKYGDGKRYEIVVLNNSFHGRTLATLTATAQPAFHKYFTPFLEGFVSCEPNDFESFKNALSPKTGGVMMELIQGESGVNVLDKQFVQQVEQYCKEKDILLCIDEVQTGNGRTGKAFCFQHFGIAPDLVTTAKGLGGGLPIGACLFFDKTEYVFSYGDHGSTFIGNPVVCAGGVAVMKKMNDSFLQSVEEKGAYIKAELAKIQSVQTISGMGLMIGFTCAKTAKEVASKCIEKGLLVLTAHEKVRLLPPLTITKEEIDKGLKILKEVIEE